MGLRRRGDTCCGVDGCPGHVPFAGQIEDVREDREHTVCRRSGVTLGSHLSDQVGDVLARDFVERETPDCRQDVDAKQIFVRLPAPLGRLGVGQVAVAHELAEGWDGPQLLAAGLRIGTKQSLGCGGPTQPTGLLKRQRVGRANFELSLPAASVDITLIEGFAARRADFEHETPLPGVEEVDFRATHRASNVSNKMGTELEGRHEQGFIYRKSFRDLPDPKTLVNRA